MKKILLPIDFAKASLNAFIYALELAAIMDAEIIALHISPSAGVACSGDCKMNEQQHPDTLAASDVYASQIQLLDQLILERHLQHVRVRNIHQCGDVRNGIVRRAEEENVDFIIMGTKGATGIRGTFFGSLTEKIINDSKITLFAIPEKLKFRPIKKILFTTQFGSSDILVLKDVLKLAELLAAKVFCLYVVTQHEDNESEMIRQWKELFPSTNLEFCVIASTDAEDAITEFIDMDNIDLLVMPIRNVTFLEKILRPSLTKRMTLRSEVALLAVHQSESHIA